LVVAVAVTSCSSRSGSATSAELTVVVGTRAEPAVATATLSVTANGAVHGTGYLAGDGLAQAAAALLGHPSLVHRLVHGRPSGQVCTMIYGGPDAATVTGRIGSTRIAAHFDRADGCGVTEWESFSALLGRSRWDLDRRIYQRGDGAITATIGTSFEIELAANATTGYQWVLAGQVAPTVVPISQQYLAPATALPGAGGWERFRFTASARGHTLVRLEYRRSFEPASTAPVDVATFDVTVTA
jgi:predicted secreted protein